MNPPPYPPPEDDDQVSVSTNSMMRGARARESLAQYRFLGQEVPTIRHAARTSATPRTPHQSASALLREHDTAADYSDLSTSAYNNPENSYEWSTHVHPSHSHPAPSGANSSSSGSTSTTSSMPSLGGKSVSTVSDNSSTYGGSGHSYGITLGYTDDWPGRQVLIPPNSSGATGVSAPTATHQTLEACPFSLITGCPQKVGELQMYGHTEDHLTALGIHSYDRPERVKCRNCGRECSWGCYALHVFEHQNAICNPPHSLLLLLRYRFMLDEAAFNRLWNLPGY